MIVSIDRALFLQFLEEYSAAGAYSVRVAAALNEVLDKYPSDPVVHKLAVLVGQWTEKQTEASETLYLAKQR